MKVRRHIGNVQVFLDRVEADLVVNDFADQHTFGSKHLVFPRPLTPPVAQQVIETAVKELVPTNSSNPSGVENSLRAICMMLNDVADV